jgi:hypothetical protein
VAIIMGLPTVMAGWIAGTITDIQGRPMLPQGVPRVPQPVIPGTGAVRRHPQVPDRLLRGLPVL